jgi:hypothetical protein
VTPPEAVILTEYIRACCPHQQIGEYTSDAWYDILSDLSLDDCRAAVVVIKHRSVFVDPAEIRAEVRRVRNDRLAREIVPAPPPELADSPRNHQAALKARIREIADGRSVQKAIGGPVREDDPPPTWAEARAKMPEVQNLTPQEKALQQAAEARAAREAAEGEPAA